MFCPKCGKEVTDKFCPNCGTAITTVVPSVPVAPVVSNQPQITSKPKKPIYRKWWFWAIVVVLFIGIIGSANSEPNEPADSDNNSNPTTSQTTTTTKASEFSGDCGIAVTAEMGSSIINYPTINISIRNKTKKEISAVQFYFVPLDVYGEEITGWTSQNKLYTDNAIPAGKSDSIEIQFIENSVKKGKLYIYSVYFADGTEWGNKDATKSTILKNGIPVKVDGVS